MKKHILTALFVMLSSSVVFAQSNPVTQSNLTTDDKGNTTGTIDGKPVKMHTDSFGNTKGTIGSARINTHTDELGNTTGKIGNNIINTNIDDTNNPNTGSIGKTIMNPQITNKTPVTPGAIGSSIINGYTEDSGNTSSKGGYKNINKRGGGGQDNSF